ncbi:unnamed protein product [Vitrella brassicaformis CCMP3155]|uniref:TOG domain-containing protein n=1 Tax=Vitrella brassicaformis (strain CCMP3155) TaxID=1169540 RepID=A0A0G4FV62_VITBC|nr:unnamed protein product [Vitrella brassicaformis CCMP3155]|eukprot:CEM18801.1 unnamed protein product [Vitrella brassicaformis CCMP3155]
MATPSGQDDDAPSPASAAAEPGLPPNPVKQFTQRLFELQRIYSKVLERRNTIHMFHQLMNKAPRPPAPPLMSMRTPVAQEPSLSPPIPRAAATGGTEKAESPNRVLKGKPQPPNPVLLQMKAGMDLSFNSLASHARRLGEANHELARRMQEQLYRQEFDENEWAAADPRLNDLVKEQRDLILEQKRQLHELRTSHKLAEDERQRMEWDTRQRLYEQLYSDQKGSIDDAFAELASAVRERRLGDPAAAQTVYNFTEALSGPAGESLPQAKCPQYVSALAEALPCYPKQMEVQRSGLSALMRVYMAHETEPVREQVERAVVPMLATSAADDQMLGEVITQLTLLSSAAEKSTLKLDGSTTSLLLKRIASSQSVEVTENRLKLLTSAASSSDRREEQIKCSLECLDRWSLEARVITQALILLDTLLEQKSAHGKGKLRQWLGDKALPVSPGDAGKVAALMQRYPAQRKLQGAACQALVSIAHLSPEHSRALSQHMGVLFAAAEAHGESQSIAMNVCKAVKAAGATDSRKATEFLFNAIKRFKGVKDVYIPAVSALAATKHPHTQHLTEPTIRPFVAASLSLLSTGTGKSHRDIQAVESLNVVVCRYACVAMAAAGAAEIPVNTLKAANGGQQVCVKAAEALEALSIQGGPKAASDIVRLDAVNTLLDALMAQQKDTAFATIGLRTVANCCVDEGVRKTIPNTLWMGSLTWSRIPPPSLSQSALHNSAEQWRPCKPRNPQPPQRSKKPSSE